MHKLIARGRLVIGNAVRRAVAGEFGRVEEELAGLRSEVASLRRDAAGLAAEPKHDLTSSQRADGSADRRIVPPCRLSPRRFSGTTCNVPSSHPCRRLAN